MPKKRKTLARRRSSSFRTSARSSSQSNAPKAEQEPDDAAIDKIFSKWPSTPPRDPSTPTLAVPDAPTLERFLEKAGRVWREAHWDTVMQTIRNARPIVDWPGESRCLGNGIIVEFRKNRFGYDDHEMWVLIPQSLKWQDLKQSASVIVKWRKRLTQAQGYTITETPPLFFMMTSLKKEGASYRNIADILNRDLEDLLRNGCSCDKYEREVALLRARHLLEAMRYEGGSSEKIGQFIDSAVENIHRDHHPFAVIGPPISRDHVINCLKSEQPSRKEFRTK